MRVSKSTSNPRAVLDESANLQSFPPAFQADVLSLILGKSVAAILADRSRAPHRLPPACSPPGTRRPTWLLSDVLAWLAEHREAPVAAPERAPAKSPVAPRAVGVLRRSSRRRRSNLVLAFANFVNVQVKGRRNERLPISALFSNCPTPGARRCFASWRSAHS